MTRTRLKTTVFFVVGLVYPLVLKGQCGKVKKEMDYIVFPKAFFSSNADHLQTFLSSNALIEHHTSDEVMTSSQGPPFSTSNDKTATSSYVQKTTNEVSSPGVSTRPVTDMQQWHHWNNSFYTFVDIESTWEDAANACSSMREGAHLVFIESELENKEVSRLAKVASEGQEQFWWIGLTDKETEGVWKWYNITASYTKWRQSQPDDSNNGEDCGLLNKWQDDGNALWNDIPCNLTRYFICEKHVET